MFDNEKNSLFDENHNLKERLLKLEAKLEEKNTKIEELQNYIKQSGGLKQEEKKIEKLSKFSVATQVGSMQTMSPHIEDM